ncbi:GntR family transcriptional regulator [Oceaniovalibus sp. ACAM 378]|uniref:GntR family transcriptional regulator n=1 Tax=Oceaniovalibus sp. ACAM 378 TaxID=2599923 RepID=UPI0011D4D345|nr:GntR family transcriptional regulator [Oceaniovalibus sp. ACAM 378]TYB85757.1 GntR family transcriptional regulator [Oceaniovalibus sp. ACAM 378]
MSDKSHPPDHGLDRAVGFVPPGLDSLVLDSNSQFSVTDRVHRALRCAIIDVQLAPGAPISENSVCRQFSVSRSPVRSAIQRLAEEGLVEVSPQRGSFVAPLHLEQLHDSHFVRRTLELALLRETAAIWTPAMGETMRALLAKQERLLLERDADAFLEEDHVFHRTLAGLSQREGVWPAIETAKTSMTRFHRYWAQMDRLADVLAEHSMVIDALERGDSAAAEAALAAHLDMVFVILDGIPKEQRRLMPF